VGVDADEVVVVAAEGGDGEVGGGALQAAGIVEQDDARIGHADAGDDLAGRILAAAVGNDDLGVHVIEFPAQFPEQGLDVLFLVQARE
jgi:hypothetical protein